MELLEFIESVVFERVRERYFADDEFAALQRFLSASPTVGDVVPASGGARKLRWRAEDRGKRGGLRVLYYWAGHRGQIWLLTVYGKNMQENVPGHVLRKLKEEFESP